jgi:GxxExxY protein
MTVWWLELKAVETILPVHEAQMLSYLKLSEKKLGLLVNFKVVHLRDGIRRFVNRLDSSASFASSAVTGCS